MQSDGNLVIHTSSGRGVWMSGASRANRLNATTTSNYGMLQSGAYLHSASSAGLDTQVQSWANSP